MPFRPGLPACHASSWSCRRGKGLSTPPFWPQRKSPVSTRSTALAALRPWPRSPFGTETIKSGGQDHRAGQCLCRGGQKRQVFGTVGIDMIAGPSEVLDHRRQANNDPDWLAADLLAQAEHDSGAQSILITDDEGLCPRPSRPPSSGSSSACRGLANGRRFSWRDFGAIILVPDLAASVPLANRIAAEHVETRRRAIPDAPDGTESAMPAPSSSAATRRK